MSMSVCPHTQVVPQASVEYTSVEFWHSPDGPMDGWMHRWMMDGWTDGWTMDGWTDGWIDEWVDGWMDEQMNG